ncbi:MAG: hydrogenase expression/formation protein HypE [Candidatus Erginobacter occultus]|nr:hydrogenase expression/formation protein HypE [Candidatus Erginobacter occultus]
MTAARTISIEAGSGGRAGRDLVEELILPRLNNRFLLPLPDAAVLDPIPGRLAFTTDSFVVSPLFFPGGDIGKLAVCGTINDLAAAGARPLYLSCALIIEEGLETAILEKVVSSIARTAKRAGVLVVTGDTKVVERGAADGLYLNTAGIGTVPAGVNLSPARPRPGDAVILSGPPGEHGLAILAAREKLSVSPQLKSDCRPLHSLAAAMIASGADLKFIRDPTRGGLAAVLNELVGPAKFGVEIEEKLIPRRGKFRAALEILGLDPLALAGEGLLCAVASPADAGRVVAAMRKDPAGKMARVVGRVTGDHRGRAVLKTEAGGERIIDWPAGDPVPRIC